MAACVEEFEPWTKFQLICKPEQSGKTFIMIKQIINDMSEDTGKVIINFIFCDQSLLLVKQTGERVHANIASNITKYSDGETSYVELSSSKHAECNNNAEVLKAITIDKIQNIICCTNSKRMEDTYELIKNLNEGTHIQHNFHINVWLDEADKYTKFIDES